MKDDKTQRAEKEDEPGTSASATVNQTPKIMVGNQAILKPWSPGQLTEMADNAPVLWLKHLSITHIFIEKPRSSLITPSERENQESNSGSKLFILQNYRVAWFSSKGNLCSPPAPKAIKHNKFEVRRGPLINYHVKFGMSWTTG